MSSWVRSQPSAASHFTFSTSVWACNLSAAEAVVVAFIIGLLSVSKSFFNRRNLTLIERSLLPAASGFVGLFYRRGFNLFWAL